MDRDQAIAQLVEYAKQTGLIQECETVWAVNTVLDALKLDSWTDPGPVEAPRELAPVLEFLLDDAHQRGVLEENSVVYRDLFDTELMGRLTPRPAQVIEKFQSLYAQFLGEPLSETSEHLLHTDHTAWSMPNQL